MSETPVARSSYGAGMLYHCGLLDPLGPSNSKLAEIRNSKWTRLSGGIRRELAILLATPGFSVSFHEYWFEQDRRLIQKWMKDTEGLEADAIENWCSATRDDCIALAHRRPPKGDIPLLSRLQMRRDFYRRMDHETVAKTYGVAVSTAHQLASDMPDAVERLPLALQEIVWSDRSLNWEIDAKTRRLKHQRLPAIPFDELVERIDSMPPWEKQAYAAQDGMTSEQWVARIKELAALPKGPVLPLGAPLPEPIPSWISDPLPTWKQMVGMKPADVHKRLRADLDRREAANVDSRELDPAPQAEAVPAAATDLLPEPASDAPAAFDDEPPKFQPRPSGQDLRRLGLEEWTRRLNAYDAWLTWRCSTLDDEGASEP